MLLYPVWICIPRTFCFQNRSSNFTPDYMALAVSETDDITHESIQCVPACIKPFLPNGNAQLPGRSNSDALDFKHCPRSFHTHSRIRKQICSLMLHIETEETDQLLISIPLKAVQVTSRTVRGMILFLHVCIFSDR